jgi:phosphoenolpyruvate carboxykinase (GTP)
VPLVNEARDWAHGVFMASNVASEGTAAAENAIGELRRDPFAMLPFAGYNMGDYFAHWLAMGANAKDPAKLPRIYFVNWFRKDERGKFVWPGYGENMRVLRWIVERVEGSASGETNAFGLTPGYRDLDWSGLDFDAARYALVSSVDRDAWAGELALHDDLFRQLAHRLPAELPEVRRRIAARLAG